jgi:hypothetical protein
MTKEEQVQHHVNMILEWAKTEKELNGEKSFIQKKDVNPILNPKPNDTNIIREAKKIAKEKLFPTQKQLPLTYWKRYVPQFMQNAVNYLRNLYYRKP